MSKTNPLTTLKQTEFKLLLSVFSNHVAQKIIYFTLKGVPRKIPKFKEAKNSSLKGSSLKLEFILMYLKENPTQKYYAKLFKISQAKVNEWIHFLNPLLESSLKELGDCYTHKEKEDVLLFDVVENQVTRQVNLDNQEEEYSGKKKMHTMKYLAISNEQRFIYYLSPAYFGAKHDKSILDDLSIKIADISLLFDLGVQNEFENAIIPYKKPKNGKLNKIQKETNKAISSIRIEHAFSGVKRLRIIHEKIRIKTFEKREQIMRIAVGLHNFRCSLRSILKKP
ncbi:transposase [Tenacibaculum finnmarkense genomovar finnmarkense]|uniref:transposase n=1 Tax=Tenacibaculum finnmarkense TaxID=2781243 RepID=UPI001E42F9B7|nr:transposase [Tenacibaculum finnmarkense]MCD8417059.1 transposase [Tenacibaculum finnmarkense genomovar finnmarkense]MCG8184548.1 transposase [Tenacibaculum finnmarkense genomovar finnmarkense]MCG8201991.1 transposase [Tenacibaculum finnmarkense genomovar finnmarkense]MCG8208746.1 transposase [Tenacibaculum finnmarkense genomovar finnmarkense]MCG8211477.1 transposase [Tenacibaculum finnmarkense genomovar finnmarkense]